MLTAILFYSLLAGAPISQEGLSRAEFCQALKLVQTGWSKEQVAQTVGIPDDIWPANDSIKYVSYGTEAWCYGTHGHHTFPTLGKVQFENDRVVWVTGERDEPPSSRLISDAELGEALNVMDGNSQFSPFHSDTLHLIKVANYLKPKSKEKVLAIFEEYYRVQTHVQFDNWLFWLTRLVFDSKAPYGAFAAPNLGQMTPDRPRNPQDWPTYPLVFVDGLPINLYRGALLRGAGESFPGYVKNHQPDWAMSNTPITPPDDPFVAYKKLISSSAWPFPPYDPKTNRHTIPYLEDEGYALKEILNLVRTAYVPKGMEGGLGYVNGFDYDKYHQEFLALRCRWDAGRQMYVRGDGSVIEEPEYNYPQYQHTFRGIPQLDVVVTFYRENPTAVSFEYECKEAGSKDLPPAIVVAEDARTGAELAWTSINGYGSNDRDEALMRPPHPPSMLRSGSGMGFELGEGQPVRFAVLFNDKRYISPVFEP